MPYLAKMTSNCANDIRDVDIIFDEATQKESIIKWCLSVNKMIHSDDRKLLEEVAESIYIRIMEGTSFIKYEVLCRNKVKMLPHVKFDITLQKYVSKLYFTVKKCKSDSIYSTDDDFCKSSDMCLCNYSHPKTKDCEFLEITPKITPEDIDNWFKKFEKIENMDLSYLSKETCAQILKYQYKLNRDIYGSYLACSCLACDKFVYNNESYIVDIISKNFNN